MKYVLGLDVGIASVGWAVLRLSEEGLADRIEALGVRAFTRAEEPKTKAPLAEARRLYRSTRRRLRRRAGRLRRARDLFISYGLLPREQAEAILSGSDSIGTPWALRAEALDRLLTGPELARALYHIVRRRGFKSNRKKDSSAEDKEARKVLAAIGKNRARMAEMGWRTAGEMYQRDEQFADRKRNSDGFYGFSVDRGLLEDEVKAICSAQRSLGSALATEQFESDIVSVFSWQMPFARGDQILKLVGPCTFEPTEKRAPKCAWTTERFTLLGHLNRLVISDKDGDRYLTPDEREQIEAMAYSHVSLTHAQLRKALALSDDARFKGLTYPRGDAEDPLKCETATFCRLRGYHDTRKVMEAAGLWEQVSADPDAMDAIAFALTFYKTDEDIHDSLKDGGLQPDVAAAAESIPQFSGVSHLSIRAMRKIIPFLEKGMFYSDACEAAGYAHSDSSASGTLGKLPVIDPDEVRNPVALRALTQTRKVVNAVIDRFGCAPARVHIELARQIGKSAEKRDEISKQIEKSRSDKAADRERFEGDFHRPPSEEDLIKFRLYSEQHGKCAYCHHGKPADDLDIARLFEPHYAEIDHILPYSRSFDDSIGNRALVCAACNQQKRNRTPFEWFGQDEGRWEAFASWVAATIRQPRKRSGLLAKEFAKRQEDFFERNLKDTQYIARYLATYIRKNLKLSDPEDKAPVMCLNGRVVAMARGLWGIAKVRQENDLHHAADAAVIAALTPGQIRQITEYHKAVETGELRSDIDLSTGEVLAEYIRNRKFTFPPPWPQFRRELVARLSDDPAAAIAGLELPAYAADPPEVIPVIVSRMPCHKVGGALHAETIRSVKEKDGKRISVVRKPLRSLSPGDLDNLCDESGLLKAALQARLDEFAQVDEKRRSSKAFAEPFYWERPDGSRRLVKSVRVRQVQPSGISIRGGVADNGDVVRVDVFVRDGKYWLVPVYTSHVAARVLPNKAIADSKPEEEWPEMTPEYKFLYTLRRYDLVRVRSKNTEVLGYYRGAHRGDGRIFVSLANSNDQQLGIGARTATIAKLRISVLGDQIEDAPPEVRRNGVENGSDNEPGKPPGTG